MDYYNNVNKGTVNTAQSEMEIDDLTLKESLRNNMNTYTERPPAHTN